MLRDGTLTYVSLFSSAGVGCYGFQMEGFRCIATNELVERRLDVQRHNGKCDHESGYVLGDLTDPAVKEALYREVALWEGSRRNDRVDVVVATPPCQGISVINHKKNAGDLRRNSLVVESVETIREIRPRFFVMENVMAFEKAVCTTPQGSLMRIGDFIRGALGADYVISSRVLNFMNYGSGSSRTRTLILGVSREYRNIIVPYDLFPPYRREPTLRQVIGGMPSLEWGQIDDADFYHAFRTYRPAMRAWIHDLKEGESAFDNADPQRHPHRVVNGMLVQNVRKNRDKYTRQRWDRFAQCVHTRNDQLAAQNTVHPEQDRVLSIRELMRLMSVPDDFRWLNERLDVLNALPEAEKRSLYRRNEMNIRQCLGEAVPTEVMRQVAHAIRVAMSRRHASPSTIRATIAAHGLEERRRLVDFITTNPLDMDVASLMRVAELCNARRDETAAYYTNKFLVNKIMERLPSFGKETIRILEPSVGAGCFVPLLFKRYDSVPHVILDLVDIDGESLETLDVLLRACGVPENFEIHVHEADFFSTSFPYRFDLAVGNPPFSKVRTQAAKDWRATRNANKVTRSLAEMFLEKCMACADFVALVLNKNILSSGEFAATRDILRDMRMESIIDFGRQGFSGVSIETICLMVAPQRKPAETYVYSVKSNRRIVQPQASITDDRLPCFVIYRDEEFDEVLERLDLDVFDVFRDRQITKRMTRGEGDESDIWVLKARNIEDGGVIRHIAGYDAFIDCASLRGLATSKYIGDRSVYLTPNMTYNPRLVANPGNVVTDGSVAVLIPKETLRLSERQLGYFESDEFRHFYQVARNLATQSINVDSTSVYFYGVLHE